ncbi:MAG: Lrp/AsnC family transcriptional regulator [Desulfatiglandaceae bacterium]|jgi:Lrp/AsnC family transcriptional regulator for asnA, asnC and gidA
MNKKKLDALDNKIIRLVVEDGRMPIGEMVKRLNVTAPTIRSRLINLEKRKLLKVSGIIDPEQHQEMTTALVAMSIQSQGKMDEILEKIARLPNVVWAGVVAGRYDIIAEVVFAGGKAELYKFTTETILKMGNVVRSETFVIMKSRHNWMRPPNGLEEI